MAGTITYTVMTTAGSRTHEIYDDAENEAIVDSINGALEGFSSGFTILNPLTVYVLSNVISVSVVGGPPEVMEELQRNLGLTTGKDD